MSDIELDKAAALLAENGFNVIPKPDVQNMGRPKGSKNRYAIDKPQIMPFQVVRGRTALECLDRNGPEFIHWMMEYALKFPHSPTGRQFAVLLGQKLMPNLANPRGLDNKNDRNIFNGLHGLTISQLNDMRDGTMTARDMGDLFGVEVEEAKTVDTPGPEEEASAPAEQTEGRGPVVGCEIDGVEQ